MSSARPDRAEGWRATRPGVRLALGYAVVFALSATALFALTYAALGFFLHRQDSAFLRSQLDAAEATYARDGLAGVRRLAARLQGDDRGEEVLIRIADADNATRLLALPDAWLPGDFARLGTEAPRVGGPVELWNEREGQSLDYYTRRLPGGDVLQVGLNSDERDDVLEAFPRVVGVVAVPLLLLAVFGGWLMAVRALRPVRQLIGTLEAIADTGDVRERAPAPEARGEFADLFALFNRMLDRIEGLVGRLRGTLDDVAHDLRTPLTALRGTAELALQQERDAEGYRRALGRIVESAEAAEATLATVMEVAEAEAGALRLDRTPVDLDAVVADVADLFGLVAEEKGVALTVGPGRAGTVDGDRQRLRRALANLVDNAVKYTPPGERVDIEAGGAPGAALVTVRDTGVGIAPDELPLVWDRLYRSERTRHERGLGLGLSLARAIAEAHGGRLDAESTLGGGSAFTLRLPVGAASLSKV
ncbi:sensor histidine kinase [Rubrivirga marina]|uniref:histidine kinase n=1 Tax=Rubrivirga marina TaxID=1196024 RepID=A0A271J2Q1_9BACT|nr:ATP-binding protein [Rubrivirga marina]PAP77796.1 hypothetical protein BSZ37_15765 [Rubrivirga marina]